MRILLLRHAVTDETGKSLTGRLPGVSLSPAGLSMATDLGEALATTGLDAVYTSPIARCRETATAVARPHGLRPKSRSAFIEADYGKWSGRPLKSLYRLKAWSRLMAEPARFRFPDGETLHEVQYRAVQGIQRLVAEHRSSDTVAVCSHSDVIRVTLAHHLGMPLDLIHRLDVRPASISVIVLHPGGRVFVPVVNAPSLAVRGGA